MSVLQICPHIIRLTAFVRRAAARAREQVITRKIQKERERGEKIKTCLQRGEMKNVRICLSTLSDDGYCQFIASVVSGCACVCDRDRIIKRKFCNDFFTSYECNSVGAFLKNEKVVVSFKSC